MGSPVNNITSVTYDRATWTTLSNVALKNPDGSEPLTTYQWPQQAFSPGGFQFTIDIARDDPNKAKINDNTVGNPVNLFEDFGDIVSQKIELGSNWTITNLTKSGNNVQTFTLNFIESEPEPESRGAEYLKTECINREIFSQNPSVAIELFEISNIANSEEIIRFHGGINNLRSSIIFDSKEYYYIPYLAEDFGARSDGKLTRPQLSVINFEGIFSRYISDKDDLLGASVKRIRTFLRFLDEENFLNYNQDIDYWNSMGVNPDSSAKLMDEEWVINQKVLENKNLIKYELSSPLDLENVLVPKRQIINNYCAWKYRGKGCAYSGIPKADSNDVVFNGVLVDRGEWAESIAYLRNDFVFLNIKDGQSTRKVFFVCLEDNTSDKDNKPSINSSVWTQDSCSKTLSGCRLRYKGDKNDHLPFGGFPGSRLF